MADIRYRVVYVVKSCVIPPTCQSFNDTKTINTSQIWRFYSHAGMRGGVTHAFVTLH